MGPSIKPDTSISNHVRLFCYVQACENLGTNLFVKPIELMMIVYTWIKP